MQRKKAVNHPFKKTQKVSISCHGTFKNNVIFFTPKNANYKCLVLQPPQPLLKQVTKGNINVGLHTGAGQRSVKTSGRRIQSKVLPPAVSTLDDKEVLFLFSLNLIKLIYFLWGWGHVTPSVLPF